MNRARSLLDELCEIEIAQKVTNRHDETRMQYRLHSNTVGNYEEWRDILGDYYNYHMSNCVTHGGRFSNAEAASRAEDQVERAYRQTHRGDLMNAYQDAKTGTNSGLRGQLDMIAEGIKSEAVDRYTRDVFARHVDPSSFDSKVDLIRDFIANCGVDLRSSIDVNRPERYANNYMELLLAFNHALRQTSSIFRRL